MNKKSIYIISIGVYFTQNKERMQQKEQIQSQVKRLVDLIKANNDSSLTLLKEEVKKIRIEDLTYQLASKNDELEKAINNIKSKLNEDTQDWLDTLFEVKRELIDDENNPFFNKQLQRAKNNLIRKITEEEVKYLLDKQNDVIKLEKELKELQS